MHLLSPTVIVGGQGAVGRMLHRELKPTLGHILDIDLRSGRDARSCATAGTVEHKLLINAATVVLAVPESVAIGILPLLANTLSDDVLLVETLSVKARFAQLLTAAQARFEAIGINPMFAPSLGMAGRAVAVIPYHTRARAIRFLSLLTVRGAQITELSPAAHDRAVAALQALPHVAILAFARAFAHSQLDIETTLRLAPPPASALLALAARIADGNPEIYYEIQSANRFAPAAHDSLGRAFEEILLASRDESAFAGLLADTAARLGESYPELLTAADRVVREQWPRTTRCQARPTAHAAAPRSSTPEAC